MLDSAGTETHFAQKLTYNFTKKCLHITFVSAKFIT